MKKKIDTTYTIMLDTQPEQFQLVDADFEVKLVNLSTNAFTDISSSVTVSELLDTTVVDYATAPATSAVASATNIVSIGVLDLIEVSDRVIFGSDTVVYKVLSKSASTGAGTITLHKTLVNSLGSGDELARQENTGSYVFDNSIAVIGRYSYLLTAKNTSPLIDLMSSVLEIVNYDLDDIHAQNEQLIASTNDFSKIIL